MSNQTHYSQVMRKQMANTTPSGFLYSHCTSLASLLASFASPIMSFVAIKVSCRWLFRLLIGSTHCIICFTNQLEYHPASLQYQLHTLFLVAVLLNYLTFMHPHILLCHVTIIPATFSACIVTETATAQHQSSQSQYVCSTHAV